MARGGILATSAAIIVALAGGVFVAAESGVHAQATKKEAPLELKEDASARPWKRYAGWPTRDYSKYNTIGNLATPPAPKMRRG
jgi:L-cysteine S-thiosulfotransferase